MFIRFSVLASKYGCRLSSTCKLLQPTTAVHILAEIVATDVLFHPPSLQPRWHNSSAKYCGIKTPTEYHARGIVIVDKMTVALRAEMLRRLDAVMTVVNRSIYPVRHKLRNLAVLGT